MILGSPVSEAHKCGMEGHKVVWQQKYFIPGISPKICLSPIESFKCLVVELPHSCELFLLVSLVLVVKYQYAYCLCPFSFSEISPCLSVLHPMLEVHPHFLCPVSIFVVGKLPSLLVKFHYLYHR